MSIYEYDKERELRLIWAEENTVKEIVSLCKKFGSSKEDAVDEVNEKCSLSKEAAQEKVNLYWE